MVTSKVLAGSIEEAKTKMLVVFTHEDRESAEYKRVDKLLGGRLAALKKAKEFEGKLLTTTILRTPEQSFKKLLLVGLGKRKETTLETMRRAAGSAVKVARDYADTITIPFLHGKKTAGLDSAVRAVAEGLLMGDYRFLKYKTQGLDEMKTLKDFTVLVEQKRQVKLAERGLHKAEVIAGAVNHARDMVSTPPGDMTPATLEAEAKRLAKKHSLTLTVFGKQELKKRSMDAILAVGRGGKVPPRMITLEYKARGAKKHLAFCGKGVCFDSGGYNIKLRMMEQMKDDMGGAAALLGMIDALATLKVKAHVTIVIGAVENLVGSEAYKPGDVVKASNGKTIEVANTDAEGRVVLADCLSYASTLKPDTLVDIATLTGAAMLALGNVAAVLSTNDKLAASIIAAGEETGDRAWRLPLWEDHKEDVKSDIADVKNMGYPMRASVTAGAVFLQAFVEKPEKWAHLDIGGAVADDRERAYLPKGASGAGVRLLTRFVEKS